MTRRRRELTMRRRTRRSRCPSSAWRPTQFSGHSLRAGGATGLLVPRVPYHIIKKRGRWMSDAAMVYYRSEEDVIREVSRGFTRVVGAGL
jgi:hypothetical protein